VFLISALDRGYWSASRSGRSTPGKIVVNLYPEFLAVDFPVWRLVDIDRSGITTLPR